MRQTPTQDTALRMPTLWMPLLRHPAWRFHIICLLRLFLSSNSHFTCIFRRPGRKVRQWCEVYIPLPVLRSPPQWIKMVPHRWTLAVPVVVMERRSMVGRRMRFSTQITKYHLITVRIHRPGIRWHPRQPLCIHGLLSQRGVAILVRNSHQGRRPRIRCWHRMFMFWVTAIRRMKR